MELKEMTEQALRIRRLYDQINVQQWDSGAYLQGFMGDVGALAKLVMAKNGLRGGKDIDAKIEHELADCLWSILVLADQLGVDLESAYERTMKELEQKLSEN